MTKYDLISSEIRQKAIQFRNDNGFSNTEPIRLKSLLLKKNVLSVFRPLSGSFSGMAIKDALDNRFMLINDDHNIGKQHFTIAHELYHLFIQDNFKSQRCITGTFSKTDIEEYKADMFAAYFLIPDDGIRLNVPAEEQAIDEIKLETVVLLEQYYSVSRKAVLQRLKNMHIISSVCFDRYEPNVKNSARRLGYQLDIYEPGNSGLIIGDYGVLANQLFKKGSISESHYVELMQGIGVNPLDLNLTDNNE
jgi:Zn-dependent peptidase ImmA (M78 family)